MPQDRLGETLEDGLEDRAEDGPAKWSKCGLVKRINERLIDSLWNRYISNP